MNLSTLYAQIKQEFLTKNIQNAEMESKRLIMHHLNIDLGDFILRSEEKVDDLSLEHIRSDVEKRLQGHPLSAIFQKVEFWGLEFKTTQDTLDPRPDTETLIEAALKWIREAYLQDKKIMICDLGTGTGCIPISLLYELPKAKAIAVDISSEALQIAKHNAVKHNVENRIQFIKGDWMDELDGYKFDLITSNPPYIKESDIKNLDIEVKNHDPILALSGGNNGLNCYKKIFSNLKRHLNSQNRAFFEIGYGQLSDVMRLVDESNLQTIRSHSDLSGIPRVVEISCGDK